MLTVWLKFIHILSLAIWCGGLLGLPILFRHRSHVPNRPELWRLQRLVRDAYTVIVSPAAFVAVVSGTALVFARHVFTPWFLLKLATVGVLVVLHIRFGFVIASLFEEGKRYAAWRVWVWTPMAMVTISAVLFLVLSKPALDTTALPEWLQRPGWGQRLLPETMRPMP